MSSQPDHLSSSATTAVDSLSVEASTLQTVSPPPESDPHSRSNSNPQDTSSSTGAANDKGKDRDNAPQVDPTHAHAQPAATSNPNPDILPSASIDAATTEAARTAIMAHLSNAGSASLAPLSQRAADIGAADESIAKQRAGVDASAGRLAKESGRLEKEAEKADAVLKDIGNVENWAQVLERDISVLEETLRIVDEEEGEGEEGVGEEVEEVVGEDGVLVERRRKAKGKEGWLWGLWQGSGSAS